MAAPLIGLTTRSIRDLPGIRLDRSQAVAEQYVEAIRWAGGAPVLLPSSAGEAAMLELAARMDGLVLTGGPDVDPAVFGEEPQPGLGEVDLVRDEAEIALCRFAAERDLPLLAVCRGIQVLNVAFGVLGTSSVFLARGHLSPWTLLAFLLSAVGVVALAVTMRRLFVLCRGNPWYLIFYPLAAALVISFQAGAIIRALGLRAVTWRGTTYKGGKVVSPAGKS